MIIGMKAQAKKELRAMGIKTILTDFGKEIKLGNAKTAELIKELAKHGKQCLFTLTNPNKRIQ